MPESLCPCGSGFAYDECCGSYHRGEPAPTAEKLMRSRYSAYVLGLGEYLLRTWHPSTRPETLDMHDAPEWLGLTILSTQAGGEEEGDGVVEFEARFTHSGKLSLMQECSRFRRHQGDWVYLDGRAGEHKIGRNSPCPCGSGKKYKRCCGQ